MFLLKWITVCKSTGMLHVAKTQTFESDGGLSIVLVGDARESTGGLVVVLPSGAKVVSSSPVVY